MRSTVLKTLLMTPVAVLAFSTHGNTWAGRSRLTVGKGTAAEEMGIPCEDEVSEKSAVREWSLVVIPILFSLAETSNDSSLTLLICCHSCAIILQCAIINYPSLPESVKPGVVTGQALNDLLQHAQDNKYAIPAVNCVTSSSINACLEAARVADAPIMIQFSSGGSQFYAGKGLDNKDFQAAIAGAVSGAYHVRAMAEQYGVPVILHTDHCAKKLLPWLDGLLTASEKYFEAHGEPLFSSHMLDLSEEPLEENIEICVDYMERMAKMNMLLEMELGITGGEEDGVNNEDVNPEDL